jgi:CubicO group peptidase (beta-lactamase class C family)
MKFKPMLRFALIGFLLLIAADVTAQVSGNNVAIDAFMQERMESLNIPGAALAIVRGRDCSSGGLWRRQRSGRPGDAANAVFAGFVE